jgi:hypothetical protein
MFHTYNVLVIFRKIRLGTPCVALKRKMKLAAHFVVLHFN